jgi:hypothetical protein
MKERSPSDEKGGCQDHDDANVSPNSARSLPNNLCNFDVVKKYINMAHPEERLPDPAPLSTFFLPNIFGIGFALAMEKLGLEQFLKGYLSQESHPYCLFGLGIFAIANCNSYLGGSVGGPVLNTASSFQIY